MSCLRHIATSTTERIQKKLKENHEFDISTGKIAEWKPFFIKNPTDKEKDVCLHKQCLNIRLLFNALMEHS